MGGRPTGLVALLAADTVSILGNFVSLVALPWLVLVNTGDAAKMGWIAAAQLVPYALSCVFATPVADWIGLKVSSVLADAGSALIMVGLATMPWLSFPLLAGLIGITGMVRAVGDRAKHVMLQPMAAAAGVPIIRVTAGYETLDKAAQLLGAPLGGALVYWFGVAGALWVDAVSFMACALVVATLVRLPRPAERGTREGYLTALRAGVRHLSRDSTLAAMMACYFVLNVFTQACTAVFIPLWIVEVVGTPAALGLVTGAFAAGVVLGGVTFTRLATVVPRRAAFITGMVLGGAPRLLALGASTSLAVVLVVTFACGVLSAAANPIFGAALYQRVPPELRTRVFGLVAAFCLAGLPLGGLLAGWSASALGLRPAILLTATTGFAVMLVAVVWYWLSCRDASHGGRARRPLLSERRRK